MDAPLPNRVFICYSRKDQAWLDRLQAHLAPLEQSGDLQLWIDHGQLEAGDRYNEEIAEAIRSSSIAVLLVSPDFQTSTFIREKELPLLRQLADDDRIRLYWLPLSDCLLADQLRGIYHCASSEETPLNGLTQAQADEILANLARQIQSQVGDRRRHRLGQPTAETPFVNSLGQPFVPVPGTGILFCRWQTRVQDFARYADARFGGDDSWRQASSRGHEQDPDHPVVNVSLQDAEEFCAWLSREEGLVYRLPSDHEWSCAIGLGEEEDPGAFPAEKDLQTKDHFPWGTAWPPPPQTGNFAGEETREFGFDTIEGYEDPFLFTAPVGSFAPNSLGLHDLAGNVWEWCRDAYDRDDASKKVARGGSWRDGDPVRLSSSLRRIASRNHRRLDLGFRCVLELAPS